MKIILGDITRPKCKNIIIPANTKGLMNRGILFYISQQGQQGLQDIEPYLEEYLSKNPCKIGDVIVTEAGGLRRRGIRKVYHAVIKRLPTDFTSISIITKTLENCCLKVIKDNVKSVALCGLGIDIGDLDADSVARVFVSVIKKYEINVEFKIVDKDKNFIRALKKIQ